MNELLSMCIPTYNRADCLQRNLEIIIPQAIKYNISIYISDNASPDNTREVAAEYIKKYPNIYYVKNEKNIGPDANFAQVLRLSKTQYAWLLGDDDRMVDDAIAKLLPILKSGNYDMVVVNGGKKTKQGIQGRVKDSNQPAVYTDRNKLLIDLGWHMTWMSGLVFNKKTIERAKFEKFFHTNFLQFAVVFDYLGQGNISVYWEPRPLMYSAARELSLWYVEAFEVFGKKWFDQVKFLPPSYTEKAKNICLKNHGIKSGLFSLRFLLILRFLGYYDLEKYKKYRELFQYITNVPILAMWLIAIIPVPTFIAYKLRQFALSLRQDRV